MSYQKQNFANGEVLSASQLNHIEDGIVDVESSANATKTVVDKIIDPTLSVSGKAADAKATGDALKNLNIRPATTTTLGGVKVGSGLSVTDDGTLSSDAHGYTLPAATTTTLGGVKVGSGLSVTDDGTLSSDAHGYTLPAATTTTLGGIKVGSGLTVDSDGRLSADSALEAYPVGSIYQSTDPTSPAALFGGSWEEIASDRVLMGASSAHAAGTTVEAGLPNIKGSFVANVDPSRHKVSGAFTASNRLTSTGADNSYDDVYKFSLDASNSNAIYGASSTVQPAAYYVHIWRRVA